MIIIILLTIAGAIAGGRLFLEIPRAHKPYNTKLASIMSIFTGIIVGTGLGIFAGLIINMII